VDQSPASGRPWKTFFDTVRVVVAPSAAAEESLRTTQMEFKKALEAVVEAEFIKAGQKDDAWLPAFTELDANLVPFRQNAFKIPVADFDTPAAGPFNRFWFWLRVLDIQILTVQIANFRRVILVSESPPVVKEKTISISIRPTTPSNHEHFQALRAVYGGRKRPSNGSCYVPLFRIAEEVEPAQRRWMNAALEKLRPSREWPMDNLTIEVSRSGAPEDVAWRRTLPLLTKKNV